MLSSKYAVYIQACIIYIYTYIYILQTDGVCIYMAQKYIYHVKLYNMICFIIKYYAKRTSIKCWDDNSLIKSFEIVVEVNQRTKNKYPKTKRKLGKKSQKPYWE